jgi:hypothetical protein
MWVGSAETIKEKKKKEKKDNIHWVSVLVA